MTRDRWLDTDGVASALLARAGHWLMWCRKYQTLWAGYGFICELKAADETRDDNGLGIPMILKLVTRPPAGQDGAEGEEDEGHLRKMFSYQVERHFYSSIAPRLRAEHGVAVAECIASTAGTPELDGPGAGEVKVNNSHNASDESILDGVVAVLMTDLRVEFPVPGEKRSELSERQVSATLDWLARFHGSTWAQSRKEELTELVLPPLQEFERRKTRRGSGNGGQETVGGTNKLWLNGGYTYLATRRKEFSSLLDQLDDGEAEWAQALCRPLQRGATEGPCVAEMVAHVLTPRGDRDYETLIHGDVKSENLYTTSEHDRVAFFDFQYVGLGLGVCDLAKLFTCSVPLELLIGGGVDRSKARAMIGHELSMEKGEEALLREYHGLLLKEDATAGAEGTRQYDWDLFVRHWETALVDWHRFQVSWGQWGNVDWLEARVRAILRDEGWRMWLQAEYDKSKSS
ncbi:uncharacterized protein B0I36DRAFT_316967 [Microdochium trichocladiopsis]|uniref:Aminoglycoside phosphotransferase domain-containing protein n=1 Tax=Microdochium trichocladiopsis TaxID=1682393 RepID=A0A9P8YBA0_9PEZI|nr:uncharacterized protein B0I36DRAFT_316967 [Microdochium trichocladiopsis]KAH7034795.1 hypothetical protein B0I36DRAFT_316967 [Microdochium trichocladiopsis]